MFANDNSNVACPRIVNRFLPFSLPRCISIAGRELYTSFQEAFKLVEDVH